MSKEVVEQNEKVMTKYDRKMAERKASAAKDEKELKKTKFMGIAIAVVLLVIVVGGIGLTIHSQKAIYTDSYVVVDDMDITKPKYDFYYGVVSGQFISEFGQMFALVGFDPSVDHAAQQYSDELTWKEYFDQLTMEKLERTVALYNDGQDTGFTYDATAEYDAFLSQIDAILAEYNLTEEEYYTESYGQYATKEDVATWQKEAFYAEAYYAHLVDIQVIDDALVAETYEADKAAYDSVDYYTFTSVPVKEADMTEEDNKAAIEQSKAVAEEFQERFLAGETFKDLAVELCGDAEKEIYEQSGGYFSGLSQTAVVAYTAEWLLDDARKEGDYTILQNEETQAYSFLVFKERYKKESVDADIATAAKTELAESYVENLIGTN